MQHFVQALVIGADAADGVNEVVEGDQLFDHLRHLALGGGAVAGDGVVDGMALGGSAGDGLAAFSFGDYGVLLGLKLQNQGGRRGDGRSVLAAQI